MEWIISGYCRNQDQARTVLLELDGTDFDWDCEYSSCTFAASCTIGRQIQTICTQEETV